MKTANDAHFGKWLAKVRMRLRLSQEEFAELLGLSTGQAIYQAERKDERRLRGDTLESLLEILGLIREEDLDELWQQWELPDIQLARVRVNDLLADRLKTLDYLEHLAKSEGLKVEQVVAHFQKKLGPTGRSVGVGVRGATSESKSKRSAPPGESGDETGRGRSR